MELREFQLKLLEMLREIDNILKKEKIQYFLVGGSVLGTVRHKGFIPWDDDIDIGLYREDFEKMEKIIQNHLPENLMYCKIGENKIQNAPIGYLYDVSNLELPLEKVPTIDIFAIDNVPESKFLRKIQMIFSQIYHLCIYRQPAKNRGKKAYYITKMILFIFPDFLLKLLERRSKKIITYWNKKETKNLCNLFGMKKYYAEIMPKEYIGNPILKEFESYLFPIPEQWDKYLTHLYGDYMKLPPKELQKPHHKDF